MKKEFAIPLTDELVKDLGLWATTKILTIILF